jgi:cell division protein FtsI (penicillin-binding protein 3)
LATSTGNLTLKTDPTNSARDRRRIYVFIGLLCAVAALIVGRLVQLMILMPRSDDPTSIVLPTVERGPILDRNGKILAISTRLDSVSAWVPNVPNPQDTAAALAGVLGLPEEEILQRLRGNTGFVYIKRKITPTESQAVKALLADDKLGGVALIPEFGRNYPEQSLASHVIGYVGVDNVGLDGIEYSFNHVLSPETVTKGLEQREVFGNQVFLTLDVNVQHIIEEEARTAYRDNRADAVSVLVMEAKTGEILGFCSIPDFDPNDFAAYSGLALQNLPLTQAYEPGSVFKIFSIASLLQLGAIRPEDEFYCGGVYRMRLSDGQSIEIRDLSSHGMVNAQRILMYSCNVGAALASERADPEAFYQMLVAFGFGRPTDLPLPGESAGILAPPQRWSARSKPTLAFGQEISVSAVQMLQGATVLANNGLLLKPHIVKKIISPQGEVLKDYGPEPLREVLSPDVAASVLEMMETATGDTGTARRGRVEGVRISAKTGTAEVRDPDTGKYSETHFVASYIGILPTQDPRLIIYAVVNHPRGEAYYGSQIAAPVFQKVAERLVDYLSIPRSGEVVLGHEGIVHISLPAGIEVGSTMPDLRGLSKRELLPLFRKTGLRVRLSGEGYVVAQDPPPGVTLQEGAVIDVRLE